MEPLRDTTSMAVSPVVDDPTMTTKSASPQQDAMDMAVDTDLAHLQGLKTSRESSPQVTDALEAMLSGSTPSPVLSRAEPSTRPIENADPVSIFDNTIITSESRTQENVSAPGIANPAFAVDAKQESIAHGAATITTGTPTGALQTSQNITGTKQEDAGHSQIVMNQSEDNMEISNSDDKSEKAVLPSGKIYTPGSSAAMLNSGVEEEFVIRPDAPGSDNGEDDHAEWEIDSSPISSSDDDSSDDDSDVASIDRNFVMLSPKSQARKLMEAVKDDDPATNDSDDTSSDDSDDGSDIDMLLSEEDGPGSRVQVPKTHNEVPEIVLPIPEINITPETVIIFLGSVESIVGNTVMIKGDVSGERTVLAIGSPLCLSDRSLIGVVADLVGNVKEPNYSVVFRSKEAIAAANVEIGTKVFFLKEHSDYVFTNSLYAKGSDASNIHDEEVDEQDLQFSDDEQEAEHKRRLKLKKQMKTRDRQGDDHVPRGQRARGGMRENVRGRGESRNRGDRGRGDARDRGDHKGGAEFRDSRGGRAGRSHYHERTPYPPPPPQVSTLNYDDDDGPYRPLTRPASLANPTALGEPPEEQVQLHHRPTSSGRGDRGDRVRGDRGGRGGRGDRADRGRGSNRGHQGSTGRGDRGQRRDGPDRAGGRDMRPDHAAGLHNGERRASTAGSRPTSSHSQSAPSHTFTSPQPRPAATNQSFYPGSTAYSPFAGHSVNSGQRIQVPTIPQLPMHSHQGPALPGQLPTWPQFQPPPPPPQIGAGHAVPGYQDPKVQQAIQLLQQVHQHQQRSGGPAAPFPPFPPFPPPLHGLGNPPVPAPMNGYPTQFNQQAHWGSYNGGQDPQAAQGAHAYGDNGHNESYNQQGGHGYGQRGGGHYPDANRQQRGDYNYRGR